MLNTVVISFLVASRDHPAAVSGSSPPQGLHVEHVVEVGDVTDRQSQDLDLGQLLVRRQRGQQPPQLGEGHVEGHHADALPGGVREAVPGGGAPPPPLLLPAERALPARGPGAHVEGVQEGLRVDPSPGQVGLGGVRARHHASVLGLQRILQEHGRSQ